MKIVFGLILLIIVALLTFLLERSKWNVKLPFEQNSKWQ